MQNSLQERRRLPERKITCPNINIFGPYSIKCCKSFIFTDRKNNTGNTCGTYKITVLLMIMRKAGTN